MRIGLLLVVLVVAHFSLRSERYGSQRVGKIVDLDPWDATSYEGDSLKIEPSLIIAGDSQQFVVSPSEKNRPQKVGGGDLVLDLFANAFDERYPASAPRTYVRVAGTNYVPLEQLATLGLWFLRATPRPMPLVISVNVLANPLPPTVEEGPIPVLQRHPESVDALLSEVGDSPATSAALRRLTAGKIPFGPLALERIASNWAYDHRYYYGDPYLTNFVPGLEYQRLEASALDVVFGRVDQGGLFKAFKPNRPADDPFLRDWIRFLKARGVQVICYAEPWNLTIRPLSPALSELVARKREIVTAAGATFIDATQSVPAEGFGFSGANPDIGHLTPIGARALSKFLLEEGDRIGAWDALKRGRDEKGPP